MTSYPGETMRLKRMTIRGLILTIAAIAVALWITFTALDVAFSPRDCRLFHAYEVRSNSLSEETIGFVQHPAPFWPTYWRKLLNQTWPAYYECTCEESLEYRESQWAMTVVGWSQGLEPGRDERQHWSPAQRRALKVISHLERLMNLQSSSAVEVTDNQSGGGWSVHVTRLPATPGGFATYELDRQLNVQHVYGGE